MATADLKSIRDKFDELRTASWGLRGVGTALQRNYALSMEAEGSPFSAHEVADLNFAVTALAARVAELTENLDVAVGRIGHGLDVIAPAKVAACDLDKAVRS